MGEDATRTAEASGSRLLSTEELFEGLDRLYESIAPDDAPTAGAPEQGGSFKTDLPLPHSVHFEITESGDAFNVRAEIPEANARELRLAAGQRHLSLSANASIPAEKSTPKARARRRNADPILRAVDLLADADREKVTATLKGGTLEVKLPKGRVRAVASGPAV
ncbi:MAG TPA: Hsp20/alpha crystallin family protein [Terriglobia bacterium]